MKISLGSCGPTDCCLVLHNGTKTKQYAIESDAWNILDQYWNVQTQSGTIPEELGMNVWRTCDDDII